MSPRLLFAAALLLLPGSLFAATFIVPTDEELVAKSAAIVIGNVEGSFVQETDGVIETVYEIRLERQMKGLTPRQLLQVHTYGGAVDERALAVPGEAKLQQGERVLLFLNRDERGRWRTTDFTLGKFRFALSTKGERLLVREMEDVVGWDHAGRVHHEPVRREEGFLRFIDERVRGRAAADDYTVDAAEVTLESDENMALGDVVTNAAPFPAATYVSWISGMPGRWANMGSGVTFYKRNDQNIAGAADGGVSTIQNGLAAWTNDCASAIALIYGGQIARVSQDHDGFSVVEFNDPQQRIGGSWTGAGTIGIAFQSYNNQHNFAGQTWWSIGDSDIVFQDGYTAGNASFAPAMTHEIGHGIGWRHSNQGHQGGACNSAIEECTSAAIMNSSVNASYGFTLQAWDQHAAEAVYPGGSCGPACVAPAIVTQPQGGSTIRGGARTLSVTASGTATLTYQWYVGTSGNTSNPIPGANGPSVIVTPGATTSYWVRVSNGCGTANSATATITVSAGAAASGAASRLFLITPCRVIDTRGSAQLPGGSVQVVPVTGRCGIPSTARAVAINITAITPTGTGFLAVYPGTGAAPPGTTTLSFRANKTRANNGIYRLSADGLLGVFNSGPAIHYLIDVTGYFQ